MGAIWNVVNSGIHSILLWIDSVVYWFAAQCYELFIKLASARIFEDNFFANFSNRIYAILGVFMLFYLAYNLLTAIVDPEKFTKGDKGVSKIATNLVVSLVILGFLPTVFSYAYRLQNYILASNMIGSLILGTDIVDINTNNEENNDAMLDYGNVLSFTVLNTFLNPDNYNFQITTNYSGGDYNWFDLKADILDNGDYSAMYAMGDAVSNGVAILDGSGNAGESIRIDYKPVISTAAGIFLIYVMLSFTIDLGIRVVKFAVLQLIAPIPVIMRAIPGKKGTFDKWLKQTLSVYFEVFVRVAFMYIAIYFINTIVNTDSLQQFWNGGLQGKIALVIIIMGILAFTKQAPKFISDLLGLDTGGLKLGIGEKLKAGGFVGRTINNAVGRTVGTVTGGVGGAYSSLVNGAGVMPGLLMGAANGWKSKGMQFGKQRKGVYTSITGDYKGSPGLFGGKSSYDKVKGNISTNLKNKSQEKISEQMAKFENPILEQQKQDFEEQQVLARDKLRTQRQTYEANNNAYESQKESQIHTLTQQYENEKATFEQNKEERLRNLTEASMAAERENNMIEVNRLRNDIMDVEQTQYSNDQLVRQINQLKSSTYSSTKEGKDLLKEIEDTEKIVNSSFDEDGARKAIRTEYQGKKNQDLSSRERKYKAKADISKSLDDYKQRNDMEALLKKVIKDGKMDLGESKTNKK